MHMHMHICMCMCVCLQQRVNKLSVIMCARRIKLPPQPRVLLCARMQSYLLLECAWLVCASCAYGHKRSEGACSFSEEGNLNLPSFCSAFIIAPNWFLVIELFCVCGVREYVSP